MRLRLAFIGFFGLLFLSGCDMLNPADPWLQFLYDARNTFQNAAERFNVAVDRIVTASFESLNLYVAQVEAKGPIAAEEGRPIGMIFFTYNPDHKLFLLIGKDPVYRKVLLNPRQVLLAVAELGDSPSVALRALDNATVYTSPLTIEELDPNAFVNWIPSPLKVGVSAFRWGLTDFMARWCIEQLDTSEMNYRQLTFCFPVLLNKGIGGR